MRIGYARVSTTDQNLDLQRDALRRVGCRRIHEDRASGGDSDRPQLRACLESLAPGDCLVVWRLDRLGRSLIDLIRIVADLEQRGIAFESLMERIETASPSGRLMFHVLGALAEFERNLIRERILAGLAAARARGRPIGRPRKLNQDRVRTLRDLLRRKGMTVARAAHWVGVSRATAFRALALPKGPTLSGCGEIKKLTFIMKKYVFKIKRGGAGDSETGSLTATPTSDYEPGTDGGGEIGRSVRSCHRIGRGLDQFTDGRAVSASRALATPGLHRPGATPPLPPAEQAKTCGQ